MKAERNVKVWTGATAIDLITARHHSTDVQQRYALQDPCLGAYVLDEAGLGPHRPRRLHRPRHGRRRAALPPHDEHAARHRRRPRDGRPRRARPS
ncbi:MAG: hypothetical protein M0C28_16055 [Candidatus Moduliflexus flocculans]|nr:hypothetical protein [Candidatus Moduliflexus flocculans]